MPSSVISAIHYHAARACLQIVFVSGAVYEYLKVPETVYRAMKAARSKGSFLNSRIKGKYAFRKLKQER